MIQPWQVSAVAFPFLLLLALLLAGVRELVNVVRAAIDVHMRVTVAMHKEMVEMNQRFSGRPAATPPSGPPASALDALRGGGRN